MIARAGGVAAACAWLVLALFAAAPAGADDLAPWRALARAPEGARLLAIARAALAGAEGAAAPAPSDPATSSHAAAADSAGAWPPPPAALYLTLASGGSTRACVGHEPPLGADVAEAVRALAPQLRTGDRRRPPVRADELARLRLVIAFAGPAEPIADPMEVDPGREGLRIETEGGRVAFLPGEARTVAWALREARRIGVLAGRRGAVRYFRFSAVTLSEAAPPADSTEDADVEP